MQAHYVDRVLSCSDCRGEFIFTAGEQVFFQDKQFKNDPKRCKPCKSRRSGLAAAANGVGPVAAGVPRSETRTTCSDCSVETTVPFKPTQGRPVLCRQCFQGKMRTAAVSVARSQRAVPPEIAAMAAAAPSAATMSALTMVSADASGATLSPAEALLAASSMAAASMQSSVASVADLASISSLEMKAAAAPAMVPAQVLAATDVAAELVGATAELPGA